MSRSAPVGAGSPDPSDLDAAEELERNEASRVELVRGRAEKWLGGLSALSGLVATVLVAKGPESVSDIVVGWRAAVGLALALALATLAYATYRAYQAAFGTPGALAEISPDPLTGLHARLVAARRAVAATAQAQLVDAVRCVFVAVGLIAGAVGITWFAPTEKASDSVKATCVYDDGQLVVQIAGSSVAVGESGAGTTVRPCP